MHACAQISVGCVRARFAKHIAILVLVDACASALGYYITGYAFAFGDNQDANGFDNGVLQLLGPSSAHNPCPDTNSRLPPPLHMSLCHFELPTTAMTA